jgi:hypothetical protein
MEAKNNGTDNLERKNLFWDDSDSSTTWHTDTRCQSWTTDTESLDISKGRVTFADHDLIDQFDRRSITGNLIF